MADKPLGRAWYAIYRETSNDAARVRTDPYGWFSCRLNVARFLDIEDKQFNGVIYGKERTYSKERTLTLADGTTLKKSAKNSDGKPAGERIVIRRTVGRRRVVLKTGKKIPGRETYHTLSFAFQSWATIPTIADALGEIIPTGKVKASPTQSDIYPQFTIPGGGTYPIMTNASAAASTKATTSINKQQFKAKVESKGGEVEE